MIGVAGIILFFVKNENHRKLINTWIYLQAVIITKTVLDVSEPVFDLSQFFNLKFGFFVSLGGTSYSIDFNFLAPIYFLAFKKLQVSELVGTQLTLKLYRSNEVLDSTLPQQITIIEKIDFGKNENWLLAHLSNPINYLNRTFDNCLIKAKDDIPIIPGKESQMAYLRLVDDAKLVKANPLDSNVFIDWVFVS